MSSRLPPITFVLPGDGRSGGVRVTVIMANLLLQRGHHVRIACRRAPNPIRSRMARWIRGLGTRSMHAGFVHEFRGAVEWFRQLGELGFETGEIVIAVGTYTVADVQALARPVLKLRFNHGFPAKPDARDEQAWRGPMPTITVSNTLVARLQELTGGNVLAVVPNGIDTRDYFVEPGVDRRGVGALYNRHPNKAPDDLLAVLQQVHARWPEVPQHVFSTERAPAGLRHVHFTRLPAVSEARAIYNRCTVWLLTSLTEGLPGVVLEAMACGCVVVTSDNDGSLELIQHERNGLVVPRRDRAGFADAIGRVLHEPSLRDQLAAGALATVNRFTWSRSI